MLLTGTAEPQDGEIMWQKHSFNTLTNSQLYSLLRLRTDIFVVEQQCAYPELDGKDLLKETYHLLGYKADELIAYARILAPGVSYENPSIGRVAVAQSARGGGSGHKLITEAKLLCNQLWPKYDIDIGAQYYLEDFYAQHGFQTISGVYLEDGIEHIDMRWQPPHDHIS